MDIDEDHLLGMCDPPDIEGDEFSKNSSHMVSPSPPSKGRSKTSKPVGPVIITCKDNIQHKLSLPGKHDNVYTVRETIIYLAPFRGMGIQ
jgi:hypothetical protein